MVPADVRTLFEAQMNEASVDWRMIIYGGVLHAFTVPGASNYGMPGLRYDRDADERSWRAMLDLFEELSASRALLSDPRHRPTVSLRCRDLPFRRF